MAAVAGLPWKHFRAPLGSIVIGTFLVAAEPAFRANETAGEANNANRIRNGRSLVPDLPLLDKAAAERAVAVFDRLRLPDVTGKPLLKDAAGDWFRDVVRALHGSIVDGERMVREPFLLTPKKSSKTSYGAALMLTSMLINERPNAEFLLIAPTQPIAEIAFNQVEGTIAA